MQHWPNTYTYYSLYSPWLNQLFFSGHFSFPAREIEHSWKVSYNESSEHYLVKLELQCHLMLQPDLMTTLTGIVPFLVLNCSLRGGRGEWEGWEDGGCCRIAGCSKTWQPIKRCSWRLTRPTVNNSCCRLHYTYWAKFGNWNCYLNISHGGRGIKQGVQSALTYK